MKIRVIKSTIGPDTWYRNRIGEVFEVFEMEDIHLVYLLKNGGGGFYKDDCEIIDDVMEKIDNLFEI
jgi:hypothetical protein